MKKLLDLGNYICLTKNCKTKKKGSNPMTTKDTRNPNPLLRHYTKNKEILNGKLHFSAVRPILDLMRFMPERLRKI